MFDYPLPKLQGSRRLQDVIYFLETGEFPQGVGKRKRQWLVRKASKYTLINDELYYRVHDLMLRKVPPPKEIEQILSNNCHEGVCSGHFAHNLTCKKILQAGFTWSSMLIDMHRWCKTCNPCQKARTRKLIHEP